MIRMSGEVRNQISQGYALGKRSVLLKEGLDGMRVQRLLTLLEEEGFILSFVSKKVQSGGNRLEVLLRYNDGVPAATRFVCVGKPSQSRTVKAKTRQGRHRGRGTQVRSTPKGIMTDREARKNKTGGTRLFGVF